MKRRLCALALLGASTPLLHSSVVIIGNPGNGGGGTVTVGPVTFGPEIEEQFVFELINRARANPAAEAARHGIDLNEGLTPGTISDSPKPPLANNRSIEKAAYNHAFGWSQSQEAPAATLEERLAVGGYVLTNPSGCAEVSGSVTNDGSMEKLALIQRLYEQWFKNPEARAKMLDPRYDESGVGLSFKPIISGTTSNTPLRHDLKGAAYFAFSAGSPVPDGPYVSGVAYHDSNSNGFYDIGEGLYDLDVKVMPGGYETKTSASGAYAIPRGTTSGSLVVTFSGTGVPVPTQIPVSAMPGRNVKVDLVVPAVETATRILNVSGNLNFGEIPVWGYGSRTLTITNSGNSPLTITSISHSNGVFSGSFAGTIAVGASKSIDMAFRPTLTGSFSGTLTVNSDATSGQAVFTETGRSVIDKTVATPEITPDDSAFKKKLRVKISCETRRATICYTLDGSEPTEQSLKYRGPFQLKEAATVKARAFRGDYKSSGVATVTYTKD